jgi:hypothetical protein
MAAREIFPAEADMEHNRANTIRMSSLGLSYVLPLRSHAPDAELRDYIQWLTAHVADVVVVDASTPEVRAVHARWWGGQVNHLAPDPARRCANGKVWGVRTGLDHARHDAVIIADDDVRWDRAALDRVERLLACVDVVAPANYYQPVPLQARYDTARVLVQRALGGDWPGTLAIRRGSLAFSGGGYDGDVLFENLELVRTVAAGGGRCLWALDLFVARRPPTADHFLGQRIRQAYDEFARPGHLIATLSVLPTLAIALVRRRRRPFVALLLAAVLTAEAGRRRSGGTTVYPASSVILAPLWILERSACMWIAVWYRLQGGVPYAGRRLSRAASTPTQLRKRVRYPPVVHPGSVEEIIHD